MNVNRDFSAEYVSYINSERWAERRLIYFSTHARKCLICGTKRPHLHHLSYERMGREPDEDLAPLCKRHHRQVHEHHAARGGSLRAATLDFFRIQEDKRKARESTFVPRHLRGAGRDAKGRIISSG